MATGFRAHAMEEEEFPERGRHAWLSLLGCFCAWMCAFGLMNVRAFIILAPQIAKESTQQPLLAGRLLKHLLM